MNLNHKHLKSRLRYSLAEGGQLGEKNHMEESCGQIPQFEVTSTLLTPKMLRNAAMARGKEQLETGAAGAIVSGPLGVCRE